jgi:hypothetical protein
MVVINGEIPSPSFGIAADGADAALLVEERFVPVRGQAVSAELVCPLGGLIALRIVAAPARHRLKAPLLVASHVLAVSRVPTIFASSVPPVGARPLTVEEVERLDLAALGADGRRDV